MCQRTIPAILIPPQEPDIGGEKPDGGLYPEVTLHMDKALVEGEEHGAGDLGGIGDIIKAGRVEGITTVAAGEIIEVDGVEDGLNREVTFFLLEQVIGEPGEIIVFEIEDEEGHVFGEALADHGAKKISCFSTAGLAEDEVAAMDFQQVDDAVAGLVSEGIPGPEVEAVGVANKAFLLGEGFIAAVENLVIRSGGKAAGDHPGGGIEEPEAGKGGEDIQEREQAGIGGEEQDDIAAEVTKQAVAAKADELFAGHLPGGGWDTDKGEGEEKISDELGDGTVVEGAGAIEVMGEAVGKAAGELPFGKGAVAMVIEMEAE